jgi:hypothetical protein
MNISLDMAIATCYVCGVAIASAEDTIAADLNTHAQEEHDVPPNPPIPPTRTNTR